MSIVVGSPQVGTTTNNSLNQTSLTYNVTTSGSNPCLIVVIDMFCSGNTNPITSITFNGVNLTKAFDTTPQPAIGFADSVWYLSSPPVGTYSLVVSSTLGFGGGVSAYNVTGANNSNPIASGFTQAQDNSYGNSVTISLTPTASTSVLMLAYNNRNNLNTTTTASSLSSPISENTWFTNYGTSNRNGSGGGDTGVISSTSNQTVTITKGDSNSDNWPTRVLFEILIASAGPTKKPNMNKFILT